MQTVARIAQRLDSCSFIAAFIDLTGSGEALPISGDDNVAVSPHTLRNTFMILAGVLAVASLIGTAIFVRDRRQRTAGLLLSTSIILLLISPMLGDDRASIAVTVVATALTVISTALNFRILRARSD